MAPHSSTLAWKIPWTEEPGRLQSMRSLGSDTTERTPLQYSCLENPMGGGAWWAAVHGVTKSQTQLSDFTFTFKHCCCYTKNMENGEETTTHFWKLERRWINKN